MWSCEGCAVLDRDYGHAPKPCVMCGRNVSYPDLYEPKVEEPHCELCSTKVKSESDLFDCTILDTKMDLPLQTLKVCFKCMGKLGSKLENHIRGVEE